MTACGLALSDGSVLGLAQDEHRAPSALLLATLLASLSENADKSDGVLASTDGTVRLTAAAMHTRYTHFIVFIATREDAATATPSARRIVDELKRALDAELQSKTAHLASRMSPTGSIGSPLPVPPKKVEHRDASQ